MDGSKNIPWAEIRALYESGVQDISSLSKTYGLSYATVYVRSKRKKWIAPVNTDLTKPARCDDSLPTVAAPSERKSVRNPVPDPVRKPHSSEIITSLAQLASLAANATPEDFQSGLGKYAQSLIAQGLKTIPAPRNISELKTWIDIHRKAYRMDEKTGSGSNGFLVTPLRTVSRRGRTVEVEMEIPAPSETEGGDLEGYEI